jgi:hypothetical protein
MSWNDRAGQLTLEPGTPPGATNLAAERTFTVRVLPEGVARQVSYVGKRIQVRF